MDLVPIGAASPQDLVSKPKLSQLATAAVSSALAIGADPVALYTTGKAMQAFGEMICGETKDQAIARLMEAEGYKQDVHGANVYLTKFSDTLDYSEDTLWKDYNARAEVLEAKLAEKVTAFEQSIAAEKLMASQHREVVRLREQQLREAALINPLPILKESKPPTITVNLARK